MRKDWNSYVGRKFDMLTVAGVIAPAMAQKMLNLSYVLQRVRPQLSP